MRAAPKRVAALKLGEKSSLLRRGPREVPSSLANLGLKFILQLKPL